MASGAVIVRDAGPGDEEFILALNAECTPAVSGMSAEDYREIAGWAHRVLLAELDGKPAGFVILIRPGSAYPSDNYAWFEAKFDRHLYVDRIAVSEAARGAGVGRKLYEEALQMAERLGERRLTAEVNEQPPNPKSMAFHKALGFRYLHSRPSRHEKMVAMLERLL
ncbi:MAG TPA: GNAT family N-acetyltransferase [Hyphomonadaceae bacterium]|nr:GNAT family N-acetyltransferase [Hyphomonadaceae bacterium]